MDPNETPIPQENDATAENTPFAGDEALADTIEDTEVLDGELEADDLGGEAPTPEKLPGE
jgi:hypothetical protein